MLKRKPLFSKVALKKQTNNQKNYYILKFNNYLRTNNIYFIYLFI